MKLESKRNIDLIVIHCADTYLRMDIGVKEINDWHLQRGWSGCGYHFVVRLDGSIEIGRDIEKMGAHCKGYNRSSIGICYAGGKGDDGKPKDTRTDAQKKTMSALIINLQASNPNAEVKGHNELSNKACPSYDVQKDMENLSDYLFML